jgi:hypothetical protein
MSRDLVTGGVVIVGVVTTVKAVDGCKSNILGIW